MKHKVEGAPLCAQGSCLGAASTFRKGKQTKGKHQNKTCFYWAVRAVHNSILKTNLPNLRRLEKLEHEREHTTVTEVSARRCMKEFAHPSIYYDMTWDIWVYWSGIIALKRGADSTILWGGRVISGPSTDTAQQVGVPVLSCAAILKLIATSYIQRRKTQTKKNRCRDKQTTRYKVVSHKFSPTTVLLSLIQLYVQVTLR